MLLQKVPLSMRTGHFCCSMRYPISVTSAKIGGACLTLRFFVVELFEGGAQVCSIADQGAEFGEALLLFEGGNHQHTALIRPFRHLKTL